jgi:hypothetical protein
MARTIEQLVRISGGGMTINIKDKTVEQLVRVAAAGSGRVFLF